MNHGTNALTAAIRRAGSQVALAKACDVSPQAVNQWVSKGKPPADKVLVIEAATGISRHELRPDIFGQREDRPQ